MTVAVIGGGGFIGTNLARIIDARIIERDDPLDLDGIDTVIHLAANADVRYGWNDPRRDIETNTFLTLDVLEAMRQQGVRRLVFASTGSVYRPKQGPIGEDDPIQATSLYAASKIAGEQLIAAYSAAGHISATILRFVSVLGPYYHHGLIYDFVNKLRDDPTRLEVIGPGTSQKSYVYVTDICHAIDKVIPRDPGYETFNVGTDETWTPVEIGMVVGEAMSLDPHIDIVGNTWVGDNPHIRLDCSRLRDLGRVAEFTVEDAIWLTVGWLTR